MRLIGWLALARFRLLIAIGRVGYWLACRYSCVGLGGCLVLLIHESALRTRYGLPPLQSARSV
jgi:hypothetical protein